MLVFLMGFALMIKVHQFLVGLRVFKLMGEKSLDVEEQLCGLMLLLFVWCFR